MLHLVLQPLKGVDTELNAAPGAQYPHAACGATASSVPTCSMWRYSQLSAHAQHPVLLQSLTCTTCTRCYNQTVLTCSSR